MCGIAGLFGDSRPAGDPVRAMTRCLAHRGPDDEGVWIDAEAGIALGHRRLAIVDLSPAGHQPMHSATAATSSSSTARSTIMPTCAPSSKRRRGARRRLARPFRYRDAARGHRALGAGGGAATLRRHVRVRLVGPAASATLSLARDRFGEKPLYYGWAGGEFVFALRAEGAARASRASTRAIDRRALRAVRCAHLHARAVVDLPGHLQARARLHARARRRGGADAADRAAARRTQRRRLSYRATGPTATSLRRGLADRSTTRRRRSTRSSAAGAAVAGQMMADVPLGAFLSGGIDSSTIVALNQKYSSAPVRTFTIGFEEAGYDEAEYATRGGTASRHRAHELYRHRARGAGRHPAACRDVRRAVRRFLADPDLPGQPLAREQVTVALSGDGGDELFGGYNRYFAAPRDVVAAAARLPRPLARWRPGRRSAGPGAAWDRLGRIVLRGRAPAAFRRQGAASRCAISSARGARGRLRSFLDEWAEDGSPVLGGEDAAAVRSTSTLARARPTRCG